ncbi:MAG: 50S ribosomal protein L29 [Planctomycetota bacterium]|jgi:large subunit ribosomal protein L29|nr:50S ribosomal protein L29 [Planctomycetota bacterium]
MKAVEIKGMEPAALAAAVEKLRRELLEMRCKVALGEDVRPHRIKESRREIARMLTILGNKDKGVKA